MALAGALIVVSLLLVLLPNPMDVVVAERAEVARAAQEQAERIEELREEISAIELPKEEREELLRQLAELAQRLRENPGDRESVLVDLSKLEETLERQMDPQADAKQAACSPFAATTLSIPMSNAMTVTTTTQTIARRAKTRCAVTASLGRAPSNVTTVARVRLATPIAPL